MRKSYILILLAVTIFENVINWTAATDGFRLLRTDEPGMRGEGLTLYTRKKQGSMKLCFGMSQEPVKSLWVKISRQTNMDAAVVVICSKPVLVLVEIELFFSVVPCMVICDENSVDNMRMFLLLLNSSCTVSKPFLLHIPTHQ